MKHFIEIKRDVFFESVFETICDTCGKSLGRYRNIHENTFVQMQYNDTNYDFCDYKCLLNFINAELTKEKK